jgi:hypothetical protein
MAALLLKLRAERLPGLGSVAVRKDYERMYDAIATGFQPFDARAWSPAT